jgi:tetratricopeptide (TPR) repeat protein
MPQSEIDFHRETAKKCFNETWDYLEKKRRDSNDEQQMLHLAHTARYHQSFVGTPTNLAVGDWQISRVYAALNESRLALQFAQSSLEICQKNNLSQILPSAYEGLGRAYAMSKDYESARNYIKKAREQLGKLVGLDEEDRRIYLDQILETEELMGR